MSKEILDLREQLRQAYSTVYQLERAPELGEFRIFPQSTGDNVGNLQRMIQIDIETGATKVLEQLKPGVADEGDTGLARRLVIEREVNKQRNAVLRSQVVPPELLKPVWAWVPVEGEDDPMDTALPKPVLDELFGVVARLTQGSFKLTKSGTPTDESAAPK